MRDHPNGSAERRQDSTATAGQTKAHNRHGAINVLLADDRRSSSYSLWALLNWQRDIHVLATAVTRTEAMHLAAQWKPSVCMISAALGPSEALTLAHNLKQLNAPPGLLLYADTPKLLLNGAAIVAAADGVVWRYADPATLVAAIGQVLAGRRVLSTIGADVIRELADLVADRDRPIVAMLLLGVAPDEIARTVGISGRALTVRRRDIVKRLDEALTAGADSRASDGLRHTSPQRAKATGTDTTDHRWEPGRGDRAPSGR
jgi:two-component system response regulator DesR